MVGRKIYVTDSIFLRDLPSLYGISDVQELNSLFTMIAYHSGMLFSYESMSKESGVKKDVIRKDNNVARINDFRDSTKICVKEPPQKGVDSYSLRS